jgi:hypothetical protein
MPGGIAIHRAATAPHPRHERVFPAGHGLSSGRRSSSRSNRCHT